MANQEVKLFGLWASPYVRRVEWALKFKGIEYDYVEEDLKNKSPLLLKYNPIYKKVPVFVHGGKPIVESLLILEYIDETWKQNPILPKNPYERAMARFWANFADEKFVPYIRYTIFSEGEMQEKEVKQMEEALEILEGELKHKKFFGGETIGLLDIVLGWVPIWLEAVIEGGSLKVFDPHKFPSLNEWMMNFKELPLIIENLPSKDKLRAYLHDLRLRQTSTASISK